MDLKDKIIDFLGDSITEGVGVLSEDRDNRFTAVIERECGCKCVHNYGVGGSRIAHQTKPSSKARWDCSFCERCWDMDRNADIVCVFGGVNDYFHGDAYYGQPGDTERTSFYGGLDYLCRTIRELYPNAVPVFFAPAHCIDDTKPSTSDVKPATAHEYRPLKDYVDAIMSYVPKYGFHVYSMYDNLGLDPNDPEICAKYTADGIHFNDAGHKVLAEKIIAYLKSI